MPVRKPGRFLKRFKIQPATVLPQSLQHILFAGFFMKKLVFALMAAALSNSRAPEPPLKIYGVHGNAFPVPGRRSGVAAARRAAKCRKERR